MRIRSIKPSFYRDADLVECSLAARYIAPGLWMMADCEGRLKDSPKQIKLELLPCDDLNCDELLDELATARHIIRYTGEDGDRYIQIRNFTEHQNPHKNEAPSKIPVFTEKKTRLKKLREHSSNYPSTPAVLCSLVSVSGSLVSGSQVSSLRSDTSSEPQTAATTEPVEEASPILAIPLAKKHQEHPVTQQDIDQWQETFPGVDVLACLKRLRQWNIDNPTKRKTSRGIRQHISSWLDREQNKGGNGRHPPARAAPENHGEDSYVASWNTPPPHMKVLIDEDRKASKPS